MITESVSLSMFSYQKDKPLYKNGWAAVRLMNFKLGLNSIKCSPNTTPRMTSSHSPVMFCRNSKGILRWQHNSTKWVPCTQQSQHVFRNWEKHIKQREAWCTQLTIVTITTTILHRKKKALTVACPTFRIYYCPYGKNVNVEWDNAGCVSKHGLKQASFNSLIKWGPQMSRHL
jgi:hypothetical protein